MWPAEKNVSPPEPLYPTSMRRDWKQKRTTPMSSTAAQPSSATPWTEVVFLLIMWLVKGLLLPRVAY